MVAGLDRGPVVADEQEKHALRELDAKLPGLPEDGAVLVGPNGERLPLPASAYAVLVRAVHEMARGRAVTLAPVDTDLSTHQAAELLNVSRPFLVKKLLGAEIPFHYVGTHRRIKLGHLLAYRQRRDREARAALREMAAEAQELGLYE
jgi:excisionase family DNA binding protein